MNRLEQYKICKQRGHVSSGIMTSIGSRTELVCTFCATSYYYEPQRMVEINPPEALPSEPTSESDQIDAKDTPNSRSTKDE